MSVDVADTEELQLRPCKHQVAGHLFEEGKAGSLVDDSGHFYKPLQVGTVQAGPRGERELAFYKFISDQLLSDSGAKEAHEGFRWSQRGTVEETSSSGRYSQEEEFARLPFRIRHSAVLASIPRFYGVLKLGGRQLVELEDVTRKYRRPSIVDIKVGLRTWYAGADQNYIERCQMKDAATTQSVLGYKVCGMQVYRHVQGNYWRASKRWCKQMPVDEVQRALIRYTDNEVLEPEDVFGGPDGAIAHLQRLEHWFQMQREFQFYSSSVLLVYEGDAVSADEARVSVRLVDFAHTFPSLDRQRDLNFIAGLRAIIKALKNAVQGPDMSSRCDGP